MNETQYSTGTIPMEDSISKTLKNTFILLGLMILATVGISGGVAAFAPAESMQVYYIAGAIGSIVMTLVATWRAQKADALMWTSLLVGFEGLFLGAVLSYYAQEHITAIWNAAVTTVVFFLGLSFYAISSGKSFSSLKGFVFVGIIAFLVTALVNMFFIQSPMIVMMLSYGGVILFSAFILYDIGSVTSGAETSYVRAAIGLYLNALNLFISLLRIFASRD